MNIIYLHNHDNGRWIEPYGFHAPTPNLMELAREGVTFRQAFCAAPTCSPSRAALVTGQSPHEAGQLGLAHLGWMLTHPERHLANFLGENGYESHLCGMQHVYPLERVGECGYAAVNPEGEATADEYTVQVLRMRKDTPPEERKPLFLDIGIFQPHRAGFGFGPNDGLTDERYVPVPPGLPDTPETRRDMADFTAALKIADNRFGRVLGALRESGEEKNTLVVYTTDHGPAFPLYKCNLTDKGLGVSLIVRGPGFAGGQVVDEPVSHLDIYPTVCEVAGLQQPSWLSGKSLCNLASGGVDNLHEALFGEVTFHAGWEPKRSVRTKQWKYIRHFTEGDSASPVLANCDDGLSKRLLMKRGKFQPQPKEQLFDLQLDPQESVNLAQEPVHAGALAEMQKRLDDWMRESNDPLRQEYFSVPDDVKLCAPSAQQPGEAKHLASELFPERDLARWPSRRP